MYFWGQVNNLTQSVNEPIHDIYLTCNRIELGIIVKNVILTKYYERYNATLQALN